ncbi:MAG: D-alanyl-D-alanine carboxypeptidase/D-alanyl-D-alanine-endopeptidase [Planctomycetota bacterium]
MQNAVRGRFSGVKGCLVLAAGLWLVAGQARAGLENEIQQLLNGAGLGETRTAVLLVDLRTGRALVELDADQPMVPASNMKLITTAAALTRLGADFKFTTRLSLIPSPGAEARPAVGGGRTDGTAPTRGSRNGNAVGAASPGAGASSGDVSGGNAGGTSGGGEPPSLLVQGGGDPAFGDPVLLSEAGLEVEDILTLWTDAVVATGHPRIRRLMIDDRVFDRVFVNRAWPKAQLHRFSFAQVAGLNFHENLLAVLPVPAETDGQAPVIQLYPYFPKLRTQNRATTSAVDGFQVQRAPGTNRFTFMGSVRNRRSQPYRVTVNDPPMFFAEYFRHKLAEAGVTVDRVERVPTDARLDLSQREVLHEINTTLAGVLDRTNQDSQNLFAEALFKRMGREQTGAPGSFENGAAAVRLFLRDHLASRVGLSAVRVDDGSGLSLNNRATARVLVETLSVMHDDPKLRSVYAGSLARAGHSGTLRERLRGLRSEVYGKSGWLGASAGYASTFSGYLVRLDGRVYGFSLLFNGFRPPISNAQVKAVQDQILEKIDASINADATRRR